MISLPFSANGQTYHLAIPIVGSLALGIFVIDYLTPLGIGIGSLYILVVVSTLTLESSLGTKIATIISIFLVFLGYWASSPPEPGYETAMLNRWISGFCILITGGI
ncbi:MAG TPA: hypothetical protein VLA60_06770, partial [Nitrospirales bacterium]|nr:hypothetical protein [Nitrospirales bacterium]